MSKYCLKPGDGNPTKREADTATVTKGKSTAERSNKVNKASNKSNQRARVLKKVIAQLMSADDLLEKDNENGDYDEEEDVTANGFILNLVEKFQVLYLRRIL
jgi:hypothetical protein